MLSNRRQNPGAEIFMTSGEFMQGALSVHQDAPPYEDGGKV